MAGSSSAVEDGARNRGLVIALVVSLVLGYAYHSLIVGGGAFVAGSLISVLYSRHAAAGFLRRPAREGGDGGVEKKGGDGRDAPSGG